jgi:wobble nucleotide-excising tRNase
MIKNLGILLFTLLLSSTTFSQKDTNKICFDYKTAQKIAADLVKGDAAVEELKKTQKLVGQLQETIVEKDSVINDFKSKDSVCDQQIKIHVEAQNKQTNVITGLEKDVSNLTKENENLRTGLKWIGGGFLGTLISLLTFAMAK